MDENNNQPITDNNVTPITPANSVSGVSSTVERVDVASSVVESQNPVAQSTLSSEVKLTDGKKVMPIRTVIIIIVALIAIVLVCLWKFVLNKDSNSEQTSNNTEKQSDSTNDTTSNPIVGSWVHCDSIIGWGEDQFIYDDEEMASTFNPDGTGKYVAGEIELIVEYDVNGNNLNMSLGGTTKKTYTYSIEGNTLNINGDAGGWKCTKE